MRLLVLALLAVLPLAAAAQLRTIPADAKHGVVRHVQEMRVRLDGRDEMLAAGAQIRDANNRIVLPVALASDTPVKYLRDGDGRLFRMWILTAAEAAQDPAPKPKPKPAPPPAPKKAEPEKKG
ncbi:MAG TPA: hypothetical protein VG873_07030 [Burkholderiales bacterium]|nr:hypothetical protein [Burkholderiales bacterium]